MPEQKDSIVERAQRVRHSLIGHGDPATVQAAVGGSCPDCGARVETVVHANSTSVTCSSCEHKFTLTG